ncbi:hypothetical protein FPV67DRAFT_1137104 [Lyophyllum atratum]|nr:hypothetical protein FPV67DRAFT_1137104 [Lyophyllum atratum]
MVLKTAWRLPNRIPKAQIHEAIQGTPPSRLAEFFTGQKSTANKSPILHRLVLTTVGRPLWEYASEIELLKAIRGATLAHRFLWDQGILHRNISAGNILLAKDSNTAQNGAGGFLTDFEFARLPSEIRQSEQVPALKETEAMTKRKTKFSNRKGSAISGNLRFMAKELLYSIEYKFEVEHTPEHDLESIIIVLAYTALRKLIITTSDDEEREAITHEFNSAFAHKSADSLATFRSAAFSWIREPFARRLSTPLLTLILDLEHAVCRWESARFRMRLRSEPGYEADPSEPTSEPLPLDHAYLIRKLDFTIGKLARDVNYTT